MLAAVTQKFNPETAVVGEQPPVSLNHLAMSSAFVGVYDEAGDARYGVQVTPDDIHDANITPRWFYAPGMPSGTTGSSFVSIDYPCRFIRLSLEYFTGPVEFKVLQTVERC